MTLLKPCVVCGEATERPYCPEHKPAEQRLDRAQRGYGNGSGSSWAKLSAKARRMQPFCLTCASTEHLEADHTPRAWARVEAGLPLRLCDVVVLCRACNTRRGSARPGSARYARWETVDGDLRGSLDEPRGVDPSPASPPPDRNNECLILPALERPDPFNDRDLGDIALLDTMPTGRRVRDFPTVTPTDHQHSRIVEPKPILLAGVVDVAAVSISYDSESHAESMS